MSNEKKAIGSTYISILGNTGIALVKWITGYLGNSYGLIADAIESTGDIFSSFLTLFGIKYSAKPADENHPYGHGKAEPIITFVVVGFLITSATIIVYESIVNIRTPHELPSKFTLLVLGPIIIIKELGYDFLSFSFVLSKTNTNTEWKRWKRIFSREAEALSWESCCCCCCCLSPS